jgi:hypothetical protein
LLSNAVLVWNAVHIARIVDQLRAAGRDRVSPFAYAHVMEATSSLPAGRRRAETASEPVMARAKAVANAATNYFSKTASQQDSLQS